MGDCRVPLSRSHGSPYHTLLMILFFVSLPTAFLSLSAVFAIPCPEEFSSVGVL